jgi:putative hydrolase of the HAD superfamily
MFKLIIFDFGGVLGTDADPIFVDVLNKYGISKFQALNIWSKHWPKLKDGSEGVSSIWETVQKEYNIDIDVLVNEYEVLVKIDPLMLELCQTLKLKGFKLAILANESLEWMDIKRNKGNLNIIFDKVFSSADIKTYKPKKESYFHVLDSLKVNPCETLFIDNMERNTLAAESFGIKSIFFRNREMLIEDLKSFEIDIN